MQTLLFNTSTKSILVYEGPSYEDNVLYDYQNIPTVKVLEGYYEVIQSDEFDKKYPILRLPISNTNMIIKK